MSRRGLVLVTILGLACGGRNEVAIEERTVDAGTIRGVVRFVGDATQVGRLDVTQDPEVCGPSLRSPRLALGEGNGVGNAIVYLDGIAGGTEHAAEPTITIDQRQCEYVPHVVAVPVGTQLEIVNSDPILHNVHAREVGAGLRTVFNIAQPIRGQRTAVEQTRLTKPGLLVLSCEAGHPWMSAYIFVAAHPYVAVTGENGEFLIPNVPPGSYTITMWHEGVTLTRVVRSLQRYDFEDPYEVTKQVEVAAGAAGNEVTVDFELTLRGD